MTCGIDVGLAQGTKNKDDLKEARRDIFSESIPVGHSILEVSLEKVN